MSAPGGPPTDEKKSETETKKPSMWDKGMAFMKAASVEVKKGLTDMQKQLEADFADVKVACPECGAVFRWPKGAKKVARCGRCHTLVEEPKGTDKAKFHWNMMVDAMGKEIRVMQGKPADQKTMKTWHVVVPQGAIGGQQVNVTLEGKQYRAVVPEGMTPGMTFPIQIEEAPKVIATKGKHFPVAEGKSVQIVPGAQQGASKPPNYEPGMDKELPIVDAEIVEDTVVEGEVIATKQQP
eukprot:CAMPEP_0197525238 /NCGR_PEP_ID=MMETSP1318-20131121/10705_1 /TAXON_ID=552666 /ORGANISM="Partenskyella glossopodia, Strain RCC365" /LENGTH=237 /DNA_ID=CAMNT_0043078433 /DNA_START=57 /DNA_END=770 /DNA_ORIENTATION=+